MSDPRTSVWANLVTHIQREAEKSGEATDIPVEWKQIAGAGRGLVATRNILPSETLFLIPPSALLHVHSRSISETFPPSFIPRTTLPSPGALTATQLLSTYLALHHREADRRDAFFRTLPADFDSHPLSWVTERGQASGWTRLRQLLPRAVARLVDDVERRFKEDLAVVLKALRGHPTVLKNRSLADVEAGFLWAWLNVNTRCLFYPFPLPQPSNLTLAPLLDLINHATPLPPATPLPKPLVPAGGGYKLVAPSTGYKKGEQVFFTYGSHSCAFLLAEYGFVLGAEKNAYAEADVGEIVERWFKDLGKEGKWKKEVLEDHGYWGDWTIHLYPSPAHPSHRLLPVLRLLVLRASSRLSPEFQAWLDVLNGLSETVSPGNEDKVQDALVDLCAAVEKRANDALEELDCLGGDETDAWVESTASVRRLLEGEKQIAQAVKKSVEDGVEF